MVDTRLYLDEKLDSVYRKLLNILNAQADGDYQASQELFKKLGEIEHLEELPHLDALVEQKEGKFSPGEFVTELIQKIGELPFSSDDKAALKLGAQRGLTQGMKEEVVLDEVTDPAGSCVFLIL